VTPYEWFSAADGRDWCVPFEQGAGNTDQQRAWALTGEEQAFVLSNFELFAAHFEAAQPRLVRQNAVTEDEDFDGGDDDEDFGGGDSSEEPSSWLKDLAEEAEHLAYDNCRTEGDITRFQLALIKAARNKPVEVSANENAAYIKYHDLGEWLKKKTEPPPGDESDSDSEYEQRSVLAELDHSIATMVEDEAKCNHKKEVSNALRVSAKLANAWRMNPPKTVGEEESFKRYGQMADFGLERAKRLRVQ
jgi:hypothetical protein